MPFVTTSFLFLVVRPGASSSVLAPSSDASFLIFFGPISNFWKQVQLVAASFKAGKVEGFREQYIQT